MSEHAPGLARELEQEPELDGRQVYLVAFDRHHVSRLVDLDRANLDQVSDWRTPDAAQHDTDPREQLARSEWLGQVVLRPGVERGHLVALLAPGRQDDHRRPRIRRERAEHL